MNRAIGSFNVPKFCNFSKSDMGHATVAQIQEREKSDLTGLDQIFNVIINNLYSELGFSRL